jgi:hypothetical protein
MKKINFAKIGQNLNRQLLIFLSLIAIFGAIIYYFYALNWLGIGLILAFTVVSFFVLKNKLSRSHLSDDVKNTAAFFPKDKKQLFLLAWYAITYLLLFFQAWTSRSDRALISPWEVIDYSFFLLYGLASLLLILILINKKLSTGLKISLLSLHYFISFAVAIIIYKIGYGFDPFIHQATMELIAAKGLVLPKPPYYLGQYSIIIISHKIFGLSIELLNKILVPCLAALFLPLSLVRFLNFNQKQSGDTGQHQATAIWLTILFLLIFTFSPFILTTPQNLSYLFLILTILAGLSGAKPIEVLILALATAAIHPLTGLPIIGWAAWVYFNKHRAVLKSRTAQTITGLIFAGTALSLPLALFWTNGRTFAAENFWSTLITPLEGLFVNLSSAGRETWLLNFVYFFADNYLIFIILAAAASLFYFYRHHQNSSTEKSLAIGLILISTALVVAYLLISRINFQGLINYEQGNYAARLLIIIFFFFLPFIILGLKNWLEKILIQNIFVKISWLIFGLGLLGTSLYLSYPRFDKYYNSHGYSTSANDLTAVSLIDQRANGPYIVLANQQVSAAALDILGFDHYYQTPADLMYFYPVPTGGPLYQYYLNMVYKNPDRETAIKAMDLVGAKKAYLVVNKYWYQSGRIINEAKLMADKWWTINNEVYIFEYGR